MPRRITSPATRAVDERVLAHLRAWGGAHRPDGMSVEVWTRALARLSRTGKITYERGWRIK